jgi:putative transposase
VLAQALMEADVTARVGAARGERNPEVRTTQRNGYRDRRWDTRVGTVQLAIPKLRQGSYFPDWLLEPRRRAERALASVVMQAYVEGISTGRVDDLARWGSRGLQVAGVEDLCRARRGRRAVADPAA